MQDLLIMNGLIVTGDGVTVIENGGLLIQGGRIREVFSGEPGDDVRQRVGRVIDAAGKLVMPGAINNHVHGVVAGPLYASGAPGLSRAEALQRLDGHLLSGTTTVLNMDGFATMAEVEDINRSHPVNVKTGTIHTPANIRAAVECDGGGLTDEHKAQTVEGMLADGAVAIAEVGGGHTLGGGGQDYLYIPAAIKRASGREVTPRVCRKLKFAVLGRTISEDACDVEQVRDVLKEMEVSSSITPEQACDIVKQSVLPSFKLGIAGIEEATAYAQRLSVPLLIHNSAPSGRAVIDAARTGVRLIAAHCNHSTFTPDSAEETARTLKGLGATIDLSILDSFGAKRLSESPESMYRMLRKNLGDTISTDWAGGFHDPLLKGPEGALAEKIIDLPTAVALVTGNVANAIPGLAPDRGFLQKGKVADIVITDPEMMSAVDTVIVDGQVVVESGRRCRV